MYFLLLRWLLRPIEVDIRQVVEVDLSQAFGRVRALAARVLDEQLVPPGSEKADDPVHVAGVGPSPGMIPDRQANANVRRRALELPTRGGAAQTGLLRHVRGGGQRMRRRRPGVRRSRAIAGGARVRRLLARELEDGPGNFAALAEVDRLRVDHTLDLQQHDALPATLLQVAAVQLHIAGDVLVGHRLHARVALLCGGVDWYP